MVVEKIALLRADLKKAVEAASTVTPKFCQVPFMTGILLKPISPNKLIVVGSNQEITVLGVVAYAGYIPEDGWMFTPKYLKTLVSQKAEKLILEPLKTVDNEGLVANCYPPYYKAKHTDFRASFDSVALATALQTVNYSALRYKKGSDYGARPVLESVFFHCHESFYSLVTANSYSLAKTEIPTIEYAPGNKFSLLIHCRYADHLAKLLPKEETPVKMAVNAAESSVRFSWGNTHVIVDIVEGNFPNYATIIPTAFRSEVVVDREYMLGICKPALAIAKANELGGYAEFRWDDELNWSFKMFDNATTSSVIAESDGTGDLVLSQDHRIRKEDKAKLKDVKEIRSMRITLSLLVDILEHLPVDRLSIALPPNYGAYLLQSADDEESDEVVNDTFALLMPTHLSNK